MAVGPNNSQFSLFFNQSQPGFLSFSPELLQNNFTNGDGVVLGDLDGDGTLDIAISSSNSNVISVFLDHSSPHTLNLSFFNQFGTGSGPAGLVAADVNADGMLDLVEADARSSTASVLLNTGNASFSFPQQLNPGLGSVDAVAVGDIDGDGKPDIVAGGRFSSGVAVLLNRMTAGATSIDFLPAIPFATNGGPFAIRLGDFDGDGHLDVCTLDQNQSSLSILLAD